MENKKYCEDCGKHYILSNWSHHIKTKKHINNCSENKKDTLYYPCPNCDTLFSHASSLSRHKKEVHDQIVVYNYYSEECDIYLKDKQHQIITVNQVNTKRYSSRLENTI